MKSIWVASFAVLAGTFVTSAHAQEVGERGYFQRKMAAPSQAFEVGITPLYNQGWGNLTDTTSTLAATGRRVHDYGGAGVGGEIDLGYRFIPEMAAGIFARAGSSSITVGRSLVCRSASICARRVK